MSEIDPQKFEKAREDAEVLYKTIGEVKCPYFREAITFNAKGLRHLKFHSDQQARPHKDQYIRFRLISLAPNILAVSHTLQGISTRKNLEPMKTNSRWENVLQLVTYYEFVAVVNGYRVRVIVKQVDKNPKYFWSIIPFWKMDKMGGKRLMYSGKPETD